MSNEPKIDGGLGMSDVPKINDVCNTSTGPKLKWCIEHE